MIIVPLNFEITCDSCGAELEAIYAGYDPDSSEYQVHVKPCTECLRVSKLEGRAAGLDEAQGAGA